MKKLQRNQFGLVEGTHYSAWFEVNESYAKIFFNEIPYEIEQFGDEEIGFKNFSISERAIRKVLKENGVSTSDKYISGLYKKIEKIALALHEESKVA